MTAAATDLQILPLRLTLHSTSLQLDFFSGPLWRSGLGLALNQHFPQVFELLFGENAQLGRLYALRPPLGPITPGSRFELGLTLIGPACEHILACLHALGELGHMGLGASRGQYILEKAWLLGQEATPFYSHHDGLAMWPASVAARHWLEPVTLPIPSPSATHTLEIRLNTPLLIKEGNQLVQTAPSFEQLIRRLHGRVAQLCGAAGQTFPTPRKLTDQQRQTAPSIQLVEHQLRPHNSQRRSSRSQHQMNIQGLRGWLRYRGDLTPFLGILRLGQVVQLGGKTAFGCGCIENRLLLED